MFTGSEERSVAMYEPLTTPVSGQHTGGSYIAEEEALAEVIEASSGNSMNENSNQASVQRADFLLARVPFANIPTNAETGAWLKMWTAESRTKSNRIEASDENNVCAPETCFQHVNLQFSLTRCFFC